MSLTDFNAWSASVTSLAVAILFQSTIFAGIVAGVCRLLRHSAPALRYWCWQIVALKKTDGTQQRRLTQGGLNVYARFSPDGKKVLYLHQTRAEGNSIWTVDVDGDNATEVVREVGLTSPDGAFWSPDGKQIAVILFDWELDEKGEKVLGSADHHFRIEIMDADGTSRRQIPLRGAQFVRINSLGDWR